MPCFEGSKASLAQLRGNISSPNLKTNSLLYFYQFVRLVVPMYGRETYAKLCHKFAKKC